MIDSALKPEQSQEEQEGCQRMGERITLYTVPRWTEPCCICGKVSEGFWVACECGKKKCGGCFGETHTAERMAFASKVLEEELAYGR